MKLILASFVVLLLALGQVKPNPVDICPDTEEVVWSLGVECNVFRNKCYFDRANSVQNPPLTIVTQEECQKYCNDFCSSVFEPVSGTYHGEIINFSNQCRKDLFTCQTGKTFLD